MQGPFCLEYPAPAPQPAFFILSFSTKGLDFCPPYSVNWRWPKKAVLLHLWNYFLGGYYYDSVSSMILSRRSFLKMAGLTVVAAAGASMFTGCGAFSTTPIKVVAAKDSTKEFQAAVAELNKKKLVVWPADANGAYLNSFLMTNLAANGLSGFAVEKAEYKTATDAETGKEYKYLEVTVKSTAK